MLAKNGATVTDPSCLIKVCDCGVPVQVMMAISHKNKVRCMGCPRRVTFINVTDVADMADQSRFHQFDPPTATNAYTGQATLRLIASQKLQFTVD
jgi:hypothetical protein